MVEITTDELKQLLLNCKKAAQYAWNHYEEFAARKPTYTLFGPYSYGIGANAPSSLTPPKERQLALSTKKKNYYIYELDDNYKILRTISMREYTETECVFYHFTLDNVVYACAFRGNEKKPFGSAVYATKFTGDIPNCFMIGHYSVAVLSVEFYENVSANKRAVTYYEYRPKSKYSHCGYPIDLNAPINALNSPVSRHCAEDIPLYIPFSYWFENPEALKPKKKTPRVKKDIYEDVEKWLDKALDQSVPPEIEAFCFNLYDNAGDTWSMELIGATHFDPENDDWACNEATHFGTRENPHSWEEDAQWEAILRKVARTLRKYLKEGKHADLLKSKSAVGVGFVEGDITILHLQKSLGTGDGLREP